MSAASGRRRPLHSAPTERCGGVGETAESALGCGLGRHDRRGRRRQPARATRRRPPSFGDVGCVRGRVARAARRIRGDPSRRLTTCRRATAACRGGIGSRRTRTLRERRCHRRPTRLRVRFRPASAKRRAERRRRHDRALPWRWLRRTRSPCRPPESRRAPVSVLRAWGRRRRSGRSARRRRGPATGRRRRHDRCRRPRRRWRCSGELRFHSAHVLTVTEVCSSTTPASRSGPLTASPVNVSNTDDESRSYITLFERLSNPDVRSTNGSAPPALVGVEGLRRPAERAVRESRTGVRRS